MTEQTISKENLHKYQINDYDTEAAILIFNGIANFGSITIEPDSEEEKPEFYGNCLCVNCNDLFGPIGDAEELKELEIHIVYRVFQMYGGMGVDAWVSAKRGEFPWKSYLNESTFFKEMYDMFSRESDWFPEGKNF